MHLYKENLIARGMSEGRATQYAEIMNELHSCLCHLDSNNLAIAKHIELELYRYAEIEELRKFDKPAEYTLDFIHVSRPVYEALCSTWSSLVNDNGELYITVEDLLMDGDTLVIDTDETINLKEYFNLHTTHVCFFR